MTITNGLSAIYLRSVGKATPPAVNTAKYNRIIDLMDFYQRQWARERGVDWASLYDPNFSLGTVTATDTFDIDTSTIRKLSDRLGDSIRIVWTDGTSYTDYDIVAHDKLKDYSAGVDKESPSGFYCAQIGSTLVFNHEFTSDDNEFGGEIFVPCYTFPEEITSSNPDTDEVQVDDPDWLVTRCAAEYCRNDITRRQRFPELLTEANEIMQVMKDNNGSVQIDRFTRPWTPKGYVGDDSWSN